MAFGTSLRQAGNSALPIDRRVAGLVGAVEKFPVFGFHETFERLYSSTGASAFQWTPTQLEHAVRLLDDAYRSWSGFRDDAQSMARVAKHQPSPPQPRNQGELFVDWRRMYFTPDRLKDWHATAGLLD